MLHRYTRRLFDSQILACCFIHFVVHGCVTGHVCVVAMIITLVCCCRRQRITALASYRETRLLRISPEWYFFRRKVCPGVIPKSVLHCVGFLWAVLAVLSCFGLIRLQNKLYWGFAAQDGVWANSSLINLIYSWLYTKRCSWRQVSPTMVTGARRILCTIWWRPRFLIATILQSLCNLALPLTLSWQVTPVIRLSRYRRPLRIQSWSTSQRIFSLGCLTITYSLDLQLAILTLVRKRHRRVRLHLRLWHHIIHLQNEGVDQTFGPSHKDTG